MPILKRDVLSLNELSPQEILTILDLADLLKKQRRQNIRKKLLEGKTIALLFEKPSTRTRVSFEVAMFELGGLALSLDFTGLQISRGESIEDTAKTLSRYVDAIMARVYDHETLVRLADASEKPVINGLSNLYHPCQALADLQTIREVKGRLKGIRLAWVGDGNNVCNTLLIGCSKLGVHMTVACPPDYRPLKEAVDIALTNSQHTGSIIKIVEDPDLAVRDADLVVTDSFVSMGLERERDRRLAVFLPRYQVNEELLAKARADVYFMHCLPAHRGEEVTSSVIDGPRSLVWEEAENRLHTEKALLCFLLLNQAMEEILERS
ncbi:MAG: ornithine carbamoyltransferase [Nitrososphaerota archaeon]